MLTVAHVVTGLLSVITNPWFWLIMLGFAAFFAVMGLRAPKESKDTLNSVAIILELTAGICWLISNWPQG